MAQRPCRSIGRLTLAFCLTLSLFLAQAKSKGKGKDPDAIGCRDVGKGLNFYSLEKGTARGKQMAQEVERDAKMVSDPVIAEYVSRLGQNLARNSDAKVPFTIKILDTSEVNAFALPGGFLFVNSGLIAIAGNEAELAGVMAHDLAHSATLPLDFFEKIETLEKKTPGTLARMFSTHPMTEDRIRAAQENIQNLAPRQEYLLNVQNSLVFELVWSCCRMNETQMPDWTAVQPCGEHPTAKPRTVIPSAKQPKRIPAIAPL
jgi:predicted Zn-dependent protease